MIIPLGFGTGEVPLRALLQVLSSDSRSLFYEDMPYPVQYPIDQREQA